MKFLCDNCKAKYQIPDEKIAGRNLRMKCRKCQSEIIIRGPKTSEPVRASVPARASRSGGSGAHNRPSQQPRGSLGAEFRRGSLADAAAPPKASAVEWYVAINDVPVGPIKREEVARKIGMGAVTKSSLCWREGMDDWLPVGEVSELSSLLKQRRVPAPPPTPAAPSAPKAPPKAATPSNVIPIGGRQGATAGFDDEDEKTVLTESPFAPPTPAPSASPVKAPAAKKRSVPRPAAASAAAVAKEAEVAKQDDAEELDFGLPIGEPETEAEVEAETEESNDEAAAALLASAPPTAAESPVSSGFSAPPPPAEAPRSGTRLSPGLLIALVGAAAFGIVFAVLVATKLLKDDPEPVAQLDPVEQSDPTNTGVDEIVLPDDPPEQTEENTEEAVAEEGEGEGEESEEETSTGSTAMRTTTRTTSSSSGSASMQELSAEQQALLDRFGGGSDEPSLGRINNPAGTTTNMAAQLDDAAVRRVVGARTNQNALQRCYNTAIRGNPDPPNARVNVSVTVRASGRVASVSTSGDNVGSLQSCVETAVGRWVFPASSSGGQTRFPVVFTAP